MLLWTAVIALHLFCYIVIMYLFFICWLDTEIDSFCNLQHRIFKSHIVYINMCSKFHYFMVSVCQGVKMSAQLHSGQKFEYRP
jgi:uncharacterized membrane protein